MSFLPQPASMLSSLRQCVIASRLLDVTASASCGAICQGISRLCIARRGTVWSLLIGLACSSVGTANADDELSTSPPLPNIVLMMADDMGLGDTSAYQDFTGNAVNVQVDTPHMERLARLGIRFTDAHTPSSRCSPTRYALLTGRYPWRNRLKHWVLFGAQGDPMIEPDRPTFASMLQTSGYRTALVGKWHVGLRYRQSDGRPAAGWADADLTQPMHTTPSDHGFEFARFTSRSHGTSGPDTETPNHPKNKGPNRRGPGHVHGRIVMGATNHPKRLAKTGSHAYALTKLGSRHSEHAMEFLNDHISDADTQQRPFLLYYPSNSNHGPYTPDKAINGVPVAGAARTKAGQPMDARHDFIYENDVALGRLLDWLETTDDVRRPGRKLLENTLVIFTSDNGAEKNSNVATGPFRSHKGSVYEGGHRVPFIAAWQLRQVGRNGSTNSSLISLQDLFATFAEITSSALPDLRAGDKGAEDSRSVLPALLGETISQRPPLFFNDHKESKRDHAAVALRMDSPQIDGSTYAGQWKLFFEPELIRMGKVNPHELYDLAQDPREQNNRMDDPFCQPLVAFMAKQALLHRNVGGHRFAEFADLPEVEFDLRQHADLNGKPEHRISHAGLKMQIRSYVPDREEHRTFHVGVTGLGIRGGSSARVDSNEAILLEFDRDVIVQSSTILAGDGACDGFYQVGEHAPLAIYCLDADNDAEDQSGMLSDIGVLKAGQILRLDSSRHYGVETPGAWRLQSLRVRLLP